MFVDIGTTFRSQQPKVLTEIGAYSRPLILNHLVQVSDEEIKTLAEAQAKLTYNPLSSMRSGSGIMPAGILHQAGLTIGLGLDGAAQDNANFFAVMKAAVGIQRALHPSVTVYPDYQSVIAMATLEGAKVLQLENVTGSIEENKSADLIMINPNSINMAVSFDELAQIAMNAEPNNVEMVMVNGKILKQNAQLLYSNETLTQLIESNKKTVQRFRQ